VSNKHTRKTFFAKALAGLAGLGLLGGTRLAAKSAPGSPATSSDSDASSGVFKIQADTRSVVRSDASL
jgi:hypothetical protein